MQDIAILCHGLGDHKNGFVLPQLAEALAKAGLSSLRFDFPGNGESDGTFRYANMMDEVSEIPSSVCMSLVSVSCSSRLCVCVSQCKVSMKNAEKSCIASCITCMSTGVWDHVSLTLQTRAVRTCKLLHLAMWQQRASTASLRVRCDHAPNCKSYSFETAQKEDIRAAALYLRSQGKKVTGLVGHSKGGTGVILYAAAYDDIPRVVNVAGRFDNMRGTSTAAQCLAWGNSSAVALL